MKAARLFLLPLVLAALLAGGCGSDDEDTDTSATPPAPGVENCGGTTVAGTSALQATDVSCDAARDIVADWARNEDCATDVSRPGCTIRDGYICIGVRVNDGLAVSCARPNRSISFLAKSD